MESLIELKWDLLTKELAVDLNRKVEEELNYEPHPQPTPSPSPAHPQLIRINPLTKIR
jgi:hypothetical protein